MTSETCGTVLFGKNVMKMKELGPVGEEGGICSVPWIRHGNCLETEQMTLQMQNKCGNVLLLWEGGWVKKIKHNEEQYTK